MKVQWIVLIVVGAVAVIGVAVFFLFGKKSIDLAPYLSLKDPRIARLDDERVLEVAFSGPADTVISKAYTELFKVYYATKGVPKGPGMKPPKARYSNFAQVALSAAASESNFRAFNWKGSVAIPIPDAAVVGPRKPGSDGMAARDSTWAYGEIAEILHLGSYETEAPAIDRLVKFIESSGYRIVGDHEEEYLKGPGYGKIDPKDYATIIRYRVEKAK